MAKLRVQFGSETNKILKELAVRKDTSEEEILRRALALYKFLDEETDQGGSVSVTKDSTPSGKRELIVKSDKSGKEDNG
jgi:hypothetical protein